MSKSKLIVAPWLQNVRSGDLARDLLHDLVLINSVQCAKLSRIITTRFVIIKINNFVARRKYHRLVEQQELYIAIILIHAIYKEFYESLIKPSYLHISL